MLDATVGRHQIAGLLVVSLALAGCGYGARFDDCRITCTTATGCPDGFTCGAEGRCRATGATETCDLGDGGDPSCRCEGDTLTCASGTTTCATGCVEDPVSRCRSVVPSNEVSLEDLAGVDTAITIANAAVIDTDSGEITGVRDPGIGVVDGIHYRRATSDGAALGIFSFHALTVTSSVQIVGSRAAVFVVATTATIDGILDASTGACGTPGCAGPGGGTGGLLATAATGCGPGGRGNAGANNGDGGGGGGGAGTAGAAGGLGGTTGIGGTPGGACVQIGGEPLFGGSGGGAGSPGATLGSRGGGGGGALQITALEQITIGGVIHAGGGGGAGGLSDNTAANAGAGGGGGAGGTILVEAPIVVLAATGILAANGGGGGGGGQDQTPAAAGADATASTTPAAGGPGPNANGGTGATDVAPGVGGDAVANGGGGGGAAGVIFLRALGAPVLDGIHTPTAGTDALRVE